MELTLTFSFRLKGYGQLHAVRLIYKRTLVSSDHKIIGSSDV